MEIFIFFKPIFDMLYSLRVLDYALLLALALYFPLAMKKIGRFVLRIDLCVLLMMVLLTATFLRTRTGVDVYIKMLSAYMMYFVGRGYAERYEGSKKSLLTAQLIVISANMICLLCGKGFQIWGHANTFSGLYYYKSDLAIAVIQALCAVMYFSHYRNVKVAVVLMSGLMVVLSNSRASIIIFMVALLIYALLKREQVSQKRLRIELKMILYAGVMVFAALVITVAIISLPMFKNMGFISFDLKNLISTGNLQGRDTVWRGILGDFNRAGVLQRFFGIDFVSDVWNVYDSHNSYIKIMFSTGYIGIGLFVLFLILYITRLNMVDDRALFYHNLTLLAIFLLQSISQASIAFTQMTWILLYFAGIAVSMSMRQGQKVQLQSCAS